MGDSERIRALEQKRERVLADLERTLIDEWDVASAVHPAPLPVPQVAEPPARPAVSDQTKRTITIIALTIGGAIAAALKAMQ